MNVQFNKPFSNDYKAKYIIFFDFDETYFPHECTDELLSHLKELEEYLQKLVHEHYVKVGWVTGSDLLQVAYKMKRANLSFSPHFIASNLGTELHHVNDRDLLFNKEWGDRLIKSGFSHSIVTDIVTELYNVYHIKLVEQTQLGQKGYKCNYYYFWKSHAQSRYDLRIIRHLAASNGLGININRCNPKAGDPADAFDIDFIPLNAGKKEIVTFMTRYYQVPFTNTIAFGDSGNDIEMLKAVEYGYLLANATDEAKSLHASITKGTYSLGILETLRTLFSND
ncbi:HAD-IIB family hydrolase [Alkalihalophilus pseudofirmus]|uniref:HAD-IIB family hydrolase n=1 Tax=Alkalihalophilus pseudofirmus TaxID=79885 RepID=UPI00259BE6A5|nr:HAD-IIB family hydrolase [Alkalihalophilus pseudofirmus]WEG18953.1 HAD-IIB family hydrolase [Alkalihalophilus pseudofirmus]